MASSPFLPTLQEDLVRSQPGAGVEKMLNLLHSRKSKILYLLHTISRLHFQFSVLFEKEQEYVYNNFILQRICECVDKNAQLSRRNPEHSGVVTRILQKGTGMSE